MNKSFKLPLAIVLAVLSAACIWLYLEKSTSTRTRSASTASIIVPSKVIAPARVIPSDVSANMQAALAARQQKLAQLAKGK
jgi:hypothetical protein